MSGNIDIDHSNPENTGNIIKKDKTSWEKDLDQRINDVLNYVIDHKRCWIERKQLKMLEKNTKKIAEGKFRCTICSKLFKAEIYVTKHIKNKHQDEIAKYIADQRLRTMFENYRRDRDRLTIRSFEDNDDNKNSKSSSNTDNKRRSSQSTTSRLVTQRPAPTNPLLLTHPAHHHPSIPLHGAHPGIAHHPHAAPLMLPPYAAAHHHPGLAPPPHHTAAYPYPYPSPTRPAPEITGTAATFPPQAAANAAATAAATAAPGASIGGAASAAISATNAVAADSTNTTAPNAGAATVHPERAAMTSTRRTDDGGDDYPGGGAYGRYHHRDEMELRNASTYVDQYGRKIPIHFQEPATRTRRSYREVDVEFPADEVEEEIDYGFGDFVKNPTKFNL